MKAVRSSLLSASSLGFPINPNNDVARGVLHLSEETPDVVVTITQAEMRDHESCLGPLSYNLFQVCPYRVLCLLSLLPVLFVQEAALGNNHGYPVPQPLRLRGERGGRGIAKECENGGGVRRSDLDPGLSELFELDTLSALVFFLQLLRVDLEDVANAGNGVIAIEDFGREVDCPS